MFLIDNYVITNIEVANIVCDMDNWLISWWLMHCGKHATSCEPTICVVCKSCDFVWYVNRHFVWCGKHATSCDTSTDIVCVVENMRLRVIRQQTLCVVWKTCDVVWYVNRHCVWCGKHAPSCDTSRDILCDVENLLTSSWLIYPGKLTHIIVINVPWKLTHIIVINIPYKTYSHHRN